MASHQGCSSPTRHTVDVDADDDDDDGGGGGADENNYTVPMLWCRGGDKTAPGYQLKLL